MLTVSVYNTVNVNYFIITGHDLVQVVDLRLRRLAI